MSLVGSSVYHIHSVNTNTNWFRIDTIRVFKPQDMICDLQAL